MRDIFFILLVLGWCLLAFLYPDKFFRLTFFRDPKNAADTNRIRRIAAFMSVLALIILGGLALV